MSEFKAALFGVVGVVVGGLISISTTWMQGYMAKDKDLAAENRQKLELLLENVYKLENCLQSDIVSASVTDDCDKNGTAYKTLSIGGLYFPIMKKELDAYVGQVYAAKSVILECPANSMIPSEQIKRLQCSKAIFGKFPTGKYLQNVQDKAEAQMKILL